MHVSWQTLLFAIPYGWPYQYLSNQAKSRRDLSRETPRVSVSASSIVRALRTFSALLPRTPMTHQKRSVSPICRVAVRCARAAAKRKVALPTELNERFPPSIADSAAQVCCCLRYLRRSNPAESGCSYGLLVWRCPGHIGAGKHGARGFAESGDGETDAERNR